MILTEIEFITKAEAGTVTVQEVVDYALENAQRLDALPTHVKGAKRVLNNIRELGLDPNMPYAELRDHAFKFSEEGTPEGVPIKNRAYNLQNLESIVRPIFEDYGLTAKKTSDITTDTGQVVPGKTMYPQLAGKGSKTGAGTQRSTVTTGALEMQGLLPKADLDEIYKEAMPLIRAEYGDKIADVIEYHYTTGNRPEQLLGLTEDSKKRLTKNKVTIDTRKNTISVAERKVVSKKDNKGRPRLTFDLDSPTGQLLKRNYDAASTASSKLFDVSETEFDEAFGKHISPRLEKYADVLPLAVTDKKRGPDGKIIVTETPVTTKSAIRHIIPRYLVEEFEVPDNLVEGMMGHVNASTLRKHYVGMVPEKRIPQLLADPSQFSIDIDAKGNRGAIDVEMLSEEDRLELAAAQKSERIAEAQAGQKKAEAAGAAAEKERIETLASISSEDVEAAAQAQANIAARTEELEQQFETDAKIKRRQNAVERGNDAKNDMMSRFGRKRIPPSLKTVALTTLGAAVTALGAFPPTRAIAKTAEVGLEALGAYGSTQEGLSTREQMIRMGVAPPLATAAGVAKGVADFVSPVPEQPVVADPFSTRPIDRIAAEDAEVAQSLQASGKMEPVDIPDPVPSEPPMAAQGFAQRRNQARTAAIRGEETPLAESFLYGGIVR
tara:strand:+ start:883 stop:2877 length:1995 start_codon:yes stop_codon:yes gene_type:complete